MPIEELKSESQELIEKSRLIKEIFEDSFKDEKLSINQLIEEIRKLNIEIVEEEKENPYELHWTGKVDARKLAYQPRKGTLKLINGEGVNEHNTKNKYIEGDNLSILKLLQKSYRNKFKMIYIDPPYNTGNDFIYKDDFQDSVESYLQRIDQIDENGLLTSNPKANGRYHTNWLNMMYPRLKIAKELLRHDGVILVSIDDNEQSNLKLLLDEVFGEENFIGMFVVNSTPNARDYGHIGKMHEYVLFYAKNIEETKTYMLPEEDKTFKYCDDAGGFNIHPLYNSNVAFTNINRPNLYYPFYLNPSKVIEKNFYEIDTEQREGWIEIYPPKSVKDQVQFVWRWGREKAKKGLMNEIIGYKNESGEFRIVQKMRHTEKLIRSLLLDKSFTSRRGTSEVEGIFNKKIFSFPKPVELLYTFLKIATDKDSLVLDFFSGSATLGEAVMKLNSEDKGNRQFVLIQLPEKCDTNSEAYKAGYHNICEIGKERLRRVSKKYDNLDDSQIDNGFHVYKLIGSNIKKWDNSEKCDMESLNAKFNLFTTSTPFTENAEKYDIITELLLTEGFQLNSNIEKRLIGNNELWVINHEDVPYTLICCLDDNVSNETATYLKDKLNKSTFVCLDLALSNEQKMLLSEAMNVKTI